MSKLIEPPSRFIFMKVGSHAGESLEYILDRKRREIRDVGYCLWGYGGTACHPRSQVQPFAKQISVEGGRVLLLMESIHSVADPAIVPATEYSEDGVMWKPVPKGLNVTGSKYALVLDEISETDLDLELQDCRVAVGPSKDKAADQYLQGRVDKACLSWRRGTSIVRDRVRKISLIGNVVAPYAVSVK